MYITTVMGRWPRPTPNRVAAAPERHEIQDDLGRRDVLMHELLCELGSAEDASELREERFGGEEFEAAFARELDQPLGGAAPKERRGDDVGVKDDAQGLREARRARPSARTRARLR